MKYAIYLNSHCDAYGYWTGKQYVLAGETYPICEDDIRHPNIKLYKSFAIANSAGQKIADRFNYVNGYEVKESAK